MRNEAGCNFLKISADQEISSDRVELLRHPIGMNRPKQQVPIDWSIELLRGVAALMVVVAHYWPLMSFEPGILRFIVTGVDLFFVISGFVFAPYLFGKKLTISSHLIRRIFRIYPLYVVSLFIYAGLRLHQGLDADYFLVHLFFLHTVESREIAYHFNPAYWSLPPEVEFYLALPLFTFFVKGMRHVIVLLGVSLIVHLFLAYTSTIDNSSLNVSTILNIHLPGLLIEFLLGSVAWFVVSNLPSRLTRVGMLIGGVLLWILIASIVSSYHSSGGDNALVANNMLRGNMGLFAATAYALIVAALVGWVACPPMWIGVGAAALGNLSFGLYLFHNAAPIILNAFKISISAPAFTFMCVLLTFLLSALLHITFENPLRNFGRDLAGRRR